MHGRYVFYAETENLNQIESVFKSWIHHNGDENNWSETMLAVNTKGEKTIFTEKSRFQGKAERLLSNYSTVRELKKFAWNKIWTRFSSGENTDWPEFRETDLDDWPSEFVNHALPVIREYYQELDRYEVFNGNNNHRRRSRVDIFERVISTLDYNPPFADHGTPYDYEAFQLFCDHDDDEASILIADIHT